LQIFVRVMNGNLIRSNVEVGLFQKKDMSIPSYAYGVESGWVGLYFNLHCLCLLPLVAYYADPPYDGQFRVNARLAD
jgi:hypothetical protein